MDGLLIFDQQNDVIYTKFNDEMKEKIHLLAKQQELVSENATPDEYLDPNVIVQIFSPIIASQRIMFCQFDNSYTSLECDDDQNFVFEEFLGYLFLKIGRKNISRLQRSVGVALSFIKRICGPDVYLLKTNPMKSELLTSLLDTWNRLYDTDQAILIEAVEYLLVNSELKSVARKILEMATENLKQDPHSQRSHGCLFVNNKFLSLYSSKQAQELAVSDIVFLSIFYQSLDRQRLERKTNSHLIFLQGHVNGPFAGCIPYIMHTTKLENDVILILLIEYGSLHVASGLYDIFFALHRTRILQQQNDIENLKPAFEKLDGHVKLELDSLKKAKFNNQDVEVVIRKFFTKWDILKKKYLELFRSCDKDLVITIESNWPVFMDVLKELFRVTCVECTILENAIQRVMDISAMVEARLLEFSEFLQVKSKRNCTMASYLEEFPGLVHFLYVDRSTGRIISPHITNETSLTPKNKIWSMVELSRSYLQKGHMSCMWRDTAFSYSYFLWFEDNCGNAIKPKELPNSSVLSSIKPQVVPGIMSGEFYQWLIETCFPKTNKVKCFELYCVHLGLASASCILEHNRRLAATINEVTGIPVGLMDNM